jgi:hypothetical protein
VGFWGRAVAYIVSLGVCSGPFARTRGGVGVQRMAPMYVLRAALLIVGRSVCALGGGR